MLISFKTRYTEIAWIAILLLNFKQFIILYTTNTTI